MNWIAKWIEAGLQTGLCFDMSYFGEVMSEVDYNWIASRIGGWIEAGLGSW